MVGPHEVCGSSQALKAAKADEGPATGLLDTGAPIGLNNAKLHALVESFGHEAKRCCETYREIEGDLKINSKFFEALRM